MCKLACFETIFSVTLFTIQIVSVAPQIIMHYILWGNRNFKEKWSRGHYCGTVGDQLLGQLVRVVCHRGGVLHCHWVSYHLVNGDRFLNDDNNTVSNGPFGKFMVIHSWTLRLGRGLSCTVQSLHSDLSHLIGRHSVMQLKPGAWFFLEMYEFLWASLY